MGYSGLGCGMAGMATIEGDERADIDTEQHAADMNTLTTSHATKKKHLLSYSDTHRRLGKGGLVDMMSASFISTYTPPTSPLAVVFVAWMATWTGRGNKQKRCHGGFAESHRLDWTGLGSGWMIARYCLVRRLGAEDRFLYL